MYYGFKKIALLTILLSTVVLLSSLSSLNAQGTQWIRNGSFDSSKSIKVSSLESGTCYLHNIIYLLL